MTSTADGAAAFLNALRSPHATSGSRPGPASPAWLWPVATALHDALPAGSRDGWALRLYALLQERYGKDTVGGPSVGGPGPAVVHDWHRHTVLPLVAGTAPGAEAVPISPLVLLHTEAAAGRPAAAEVWRSALYPVLLHLHAAAYDRTGVHAEGHAVARDYALSRGRTPAEADAYGHEYAELSSTANARAFAEAHALALGDALALAYATGDGGAYADTLPGSQVRAVVRACEQAGPHAPGAGGPAARLSEGFLTALAGTRPLGSS
ncbi:hypothetical protein [Streptomyces zingiberis]|uniref:SpcZ n=1 Tax=Streptomyces zingiberis TaxID=2053010 RepID=A0ABX1C804_9ACTN|nr:hypothetical protein [Streptomyces zingiberis]NJQ03834.1 hypothetical protein [Streptomyces zingiberis]